MRNIRWQILIAIGGLILVIGLLLGQSPSPESTALQPVSGGVYSEALIGSLVRLNPVLEASNQTDRDIDRLIYSGLIRFDSRGLPLPALAESWSISADATLYTFKLKEDAIWHDGTPVTADDVVYTFSKFQDEDYPGSADLHAIWKEINVVYLDEHNVQFQLPEPFAPFLDYLSTGLLPDHLLRGVSATDLIDHPFNLMPIGTGPFRFESFLLDEDGTITGISLTAFDGYYGQRPFLERVEFKFFDSEGDALDAYLADEVQGIGRVDLDVLDRVLRQSDLNLHTSRIPTIGLVLLNTKHPEKTFFNEKEVRQALVYASDRQGIINRVFEGQALVAAGPILPATWAFADGLEPVPYEPEKADALLDATEWLLPLGASPGTTEYVRSKGDQTLSFELAYPEDKTHAAIAEALQSNWAAVGIQTEIVAVPPERILEDVLEPREFQAVLSDLNLSRFPDPDPYPFWHDSQVENGQNFGGFTDRNISIWLEQARTTPDILRRAKLYRDFQFRFRDQAPAVLLYNPVYNYAIASQVQGVAIGPLFDPSDRFKSIDQWFLLVRRGFEPQPTER